MFEIGQVRFLLKGISVKHQKQNRKLCIALWLLTLTLKAPITTAADDILKYIIFIYRRK